MSDEFVKLILLFDDAGADDTEPVKDVRAGNIRAWADEMARRGAAIELLRAVNHTLHVHGKVDGDSDLHESIDDFLSR